MPIRTGRSKEAALAAALPQPILPAATPLRRALFAGIGGGGIVTSGAILAMAAHLEGRQVSTLDFAGLAQKNGAVVSHVQIGGAIDGPTDLDVVRIPMGTADLMLAADLAVAAGAGVLERNALRAAVIGNRDLAATAEFCRNAASPIDAALHRRVIERTTDKRASIYLHGVRLAERLFGNAQAMNTLLLGLAWQRGLIPVDEPAILRSIELNGAAIKTNLRAFLWGRILADKPELIEQILTNTIMTPPETLEAVIETRMAALTAYQSRRYATRYRKLIDQVIARETAVFGKPSRLSRAAAEGLHRVMAYKDEYEVARLHAATTYGERPVFHLSPPLINRFDPATGRRGKVAVPGWVALPLFRVLRHGKYLRGTPLDVFGRQAERVWERTLISQYEADLNAAMEALRPDTLETAVSLAELPDQIRGFGPVKDANRVKAEGRRKVLLESLQAPQLAVAAE